MEKIRSLNLKRLLFGSINKKLILGFFVVTIVTMYLLVSIVIGASESINFLSKETVPILLLFLLITTVLSTSIGYSIARTITEPLKKLQKATEDVEVGNFTTRVDIKTGDELERLGNAFNQTAKALEETKKEREQLDKAKTEFLSISSHELRSPMTPMKAQLQMLLQAYFGKLNTKQKEALNIVLRNIDRLDRIIIDLLEISRMQAARLKFNFIKTDLKGYINDVVREMKGFLPEKNIKLISKIGKLPVIEVDPDRVIQVLRNLINNAIKFSGNNSKVFVNAELKDNFILFSIKDSGIGIAPENLARIFEPFFQEEQTMYRKYGGVGLGLTICRGIAESQNGKIWVESEQGKGSTFYFTVPLTPVREIQPISVMFHSK